ncbi:MAG: hypothetical protein PHH72_07620, partial [Parabacteroides sp.]|nr:hypothetical protein [Parabacteroides sp.]
MKKNLLFTFLLLCLLPVALFAESISVQVNVTKPVNCGIMVTYTPAGTSTTTSKTFMPTAVYDGAISIESGTQLGVEVQPFDTYTLDKLVIGTDEYLTVSKTIETVAAPLTITGSVVKMYTYTVTKPTNCNVVVTYTSALTLPFVESEVTITPTSLDDECILKVKEGTALAVKVNPAEGYAFEKISVGETNYNLNPYTITSVSGDKTIEAFVVAYHTITLAKPLNSSLKVDYTDPLGSTPATKTFLSSDASDGSIAVKDGTDLKVTVTPDTGYEFLNMFIGPDEFSANPKTVNAVSKDLAITTAVVKKNYLVTIISPFNGSISIKKGGLSLATESLVEHGSELVITATPSSNYILSSLKVNNVTIDSGSTITVTEAITVQAVFTYVAPKYVVSITQPANGEIVVRRKVVTSTTEAYVKILSGTEVTEGTILYADVYPVENYIVNSLIVNGDVVADGSSLPISFELTGTTLIQADLEIAQQKITLADVPNGSVTVKNGTRFVNSGDLINRGTILALQAIPSKEYKFKQWWDGDTNPEREIVVGKTDITVSALFGLITGIEQVYSGMSVYAANNAIYLNGVGTDVTSVSVVDMAGKVVYNSKPELGQTIINPVNRGI